MNTQDRSPDDKIRLNKVGITDLRTLIKIKRDEKEYWHTPTVDICIDLAEDKKGIHMSRLVESITAFLEEEIEEEHYSLEELGRDILQKVRSRHPCEKGAISFTSQLPLVTSTPKSHKSTVEVHEIGVTVTYDETWKKRLRVEVIGNTCCPHALEMTGKPHIQRAKGLLEIDAPFEKDISLEEMITVVEESFSSPVYTLLKSEDEADLIETMHENPRFVEDVTRRILEQAKRFHCTARARCISYESIHRHNVYSEGEL
jgi:GTP cyclohydrolase-4